MDADKLNSAPLGEVVNAAFSVIDRTQHFREEVRATGMAMSFLLLCRRLGEDPREIFNKVERMITCAEEEDRPQVTAVRMFMENEI